MERAGGGEVFLAATLRGAVLAAAGLGATAFLVAACGEAFLRLAIELAVGFVAAGFLAVGFLVIGFLAVACLGPDLVAVTCLAAGLVAAGFCRVGGLAAEIFAADGFLAPDWRALDAPAAFCGLLARFVPPAVFAVAFEAVPLVSPARTLAAAGFPVWGLEAPFLEGARPLALDFDEATWDLAAVFLVVCFFGVNARVQST